MLHLILNTFVSYVSLQGEELYSLIATGRKGLLWPLVVQPLCSQSTTEDALTGCQCGMQGVRGVVHDAEQLPQHPPLWLQLNSQDRASSPDEHVLYVSVSCLQPAAPAHYSGEDDAGYHWVIKHLQHGAAHIERSEPPEEVQSALTFLIHIICVYSLVQFIV